MKKLHVLTFFIVFIPEIFSNDSLKINKIDSFDNFNNKPVVVLWRGTNFVEKYYSSQRERSEYMAAHGIKRPIYCAAAHKKTGISYTKKLNVQEKRLINQEVIEIRELVRELEKESIKIDSHLFSTKRHAFQQKYTNSTAFINSIGNINRYKGKYKGILSGFPSGNPLLSFSESVKHGALYGYGMKNYGDMVSLDPSYNLLGEPTNPVLGFLQAILLTDDVAKTAMPYNVVLNHDKGNIAINTNPRCNILSEKEISLVGMVPGKSVVLTLPLEVPNFSQNYDHTMFEKFGLRKTKFNNAKALIVDAQTSEEDKQKKVKQVINDIIEGKQTNDFAYKNTLAYRLQDVFESIFDDQGLTYVKGSVSLNGRVKKRPD